MNPIVFYAMNRQRKTVCLIPAHSWEEIQCRSVFGIGMPDNHVATGIGRCLASEFESRAAKSGFSILSFSPVGWDLIEA